MEFKSNPLQTIMKQEIDAITRAPAQITAYNYKVIVHTPERNIKALMVSSVHVLRDYYTRFGDVVSLQASFPLGEAVHDILPHHGNLEITLIKIALLNGSNYLPQGDRGNQVERYTAKLYDIKNKLMEGNNLVLADKMASNSGDIMTLDFQLISPSLELLRTKTFGSTVRNAIGMDAIRAILLHTAEEGITNVTVDEGYDTKVREHINIPHNTRIVDLPKYVNKAVGGIYPTGFRYYFQKNQWYIYAPYNIKQFHTSMNTLTIVNIPKDKLPGLEVTFRKTPNQLIILATGDTAHFDHSEQQTYNLGNGVRFVDSRSIMNGYGTVEDNKLIVDRSKNVTQVANPDQQRSVVIANQSSIKITSSYNLEYSELMRRAGSIVQCVWESSEVGHLYPGMPVRYLYMDGEQAKEIYGRLLADETKTRQSNRHPTQRIFVNDSVLTLFVSKSGVPDDINKPV